MKISHPVRSAVKKASYRPVSTTVGDHVGIPVAELLISFFAASSASREGEVD